MTNRALLLQILRTPVLLGVLVAIRPMTHTDVTSALRMMVDGLAASAWLWMVLLGATFTLIVISGRHAGQSRAVLAAEVVVAGTIGLVPPAVITDWLGFHWVTDTLGYSGGSLFTPALAVVWLTVAALHLGRSFTVKPRTGAAAEPEVSAAPQ